MDPREQEEARLSQYTEILPDPSHPVSGVLLRDEITYFAKTFKMIDPFREELLKPAAYHLTVGGSAAQDGRILAMSHGGSIEIAPFGVAVVQTAETINLPRFLVARWNIKVSLAYDGLMWVGGPQVDPGWLGRLSCPVYNLSSKPVLLQFGDELAVIDFVATSQYKSVVWNQQPGWKYRRPPKRVLFEEYRPGRVVSGVTEQLRRQDEVLDTQRLRLREMEGRTDGFIGAVIAALSVLVAALAVMSVWRPDHAPWGWPVVAVASLVLSVIALLTSRRKG